VKLSTTAIGRIVSGTFIALLIGLELALSALGYGPKVRMEGDARFSVRLLPHQEVTLPFSKVSMPINGLGCRGPEWDPPAVGADGRPRRDPALLRVAVLGHSVTLGGWEPWEESFCGVLERRLQDELDRARDPRRALVMNFGGPSYNLACAQAAWEDLAHPFRPDYLVVPMFGVDIRPTRIGRPPEDYFLRRFIESTALHVLVARALGERDRIPSGRLTPEEEVQDARRADLDRRVVENPFDPAFENLWSTARARLETMRAEQASDGGALVLVSMVELRDLFTPPGWERVSLRLEPWCEGREAVLHADPYARFLEASAPLRHELAEQGLPQERLWNTVRPPPEPPPLEHLDRSPFLFFSPGHYTTLGNRLVGDAIAEALIADLERR